MHVRINGDSDLSLPWWWLCGLAASSACRNARFLNRSASSYRLRFSTLFFNFGVPFITHERHKLNDMAQAAEEHVGWRDSPDGRGTIDIIWACLFTLFICCWSVIHMDIVHGDPGKFEVWWKRPVGKTLCVLVVVLAPEALVVHAWESSRKAARDARKVREMKPNSNWTERHAHYAEMGGFAAKVTNPTDDKPAFCAVKVHHLLRLPKRFQFPSTTEVEIMDKSKTDEFVKAFALIQILWLVIQCIARVVQNLAVSTLEISTVCYIPCTIATYYFWWHKPYDVSSIVVLEWVPEFNDGTNAEPHLRDELLSLESRHHDRSFLRTPIAIFNVFLEIFLHESRWVNRRRSDKERWSYGNMLSIVSFVFGGLHCIAWNFHFASEWEKWAWRSSCILIGACLPLSWLSTVAGAKWLDMVVRRRGSSAMAHIWVFQASQAFFITLYVCARIFLLFEVFYSLRALPSTCYDSVDWSQFVPHV